MKQRELVELIGAWVVVSFAFGWVMQRSFAELEFPNSFLFSLAIALVATGTGFILHELAHKYTAIRYGAAAEFVAWPAGLLMALVLAFGLGFVFAAPGAVYIYGPHISTRQNGIISIAGPLTNIAIAIAFFAVFIALTLANVFPMLATIAIVAMQINLFLALFNMLPFGPLDGSKVLAWNKLAWAAVFLPLVALYLFL